MDVETNERLGDLAPSQAERRTLCCVGAALPGTINGRRAQIIEATMRLIARQGIAALSTRKIAREAPVNLATLHYLFGSKDDLLRAVLDAATGSMIGALVVDIHPGGGLREALMESFAVLNGLLDRAPALPLVRCEVLLYAGRRPSQAASAFHQHQRYVDALEAYYRVACAPGELGLIACDELAAVVSSCVDGLAVQMTAGMPLTQQEATRQQVRRALLALVSRSSSSGQPSDQLGAAGRPVHLLE